MATEEMVSKMEELNISMKIQDPDEEPLKFRYINKNYASLIVMSKEVLVPYIQEVTKMTEENEWFKGMKERVEGMDEIRMFEYNVSGLGDRVNAIMKQVIGKDGCYFIRTTSDANLVFLWYNRLTRCIEFYGGDSEIRDGINRINYRLQKFIN